MTWQSIDVYLRSIERFGAAGAILTSGQAVTLRFPTKAIAMRRR